MFKTSGLMLDVNDDINGEVLRSYFPTQAAIPETIKTAHALSSEERDRLPDDDFALVLLNEDQRLRKYACIDEGNTQLSVLYFIANGHKLPEEAQKTAAANLLTACGWYNIEPPEELTKVAFGATLAKGLSLMSIPATVGGVHSQIKQNMNGVRAHEAAGTNVVTPQEMKMAEVSGTGIMPAQQPGNLSRKGAGFPVAKVAGMGHLVKGHKGADQNFGPEESNKYDGYTKGEQVQSFKQTNLRSLKPYVDVSTKETPKHASKGAVTHFALHDQFPLDSYVDVKTASAYFEEYKGQFSPEDRHEYCKNLVKRASAFYIPVSADVQKYGSEEYAPDEEIKVACDIRRNNLGDDAARLILIELEEKRATISPELFSEALAEFDRVMGLDQYYDSYIPDPFYSTYGVKEAEAYSFVNGNDMVTERELVRFGKTMHKSLVATFGEDFADEFHKDPVGIFKSMPLSQKKMIMHMASDNAPGAEIVP